MPVRQDLLERALDAATQAAGGNGFLILQAGQWSVHALVATGEVAEQVLDIDGELFRVRSPEVEQGLIATESSLPKLLASLSSYSGVAAQIEEAFADITLNEPARSVERASVPATPAPPPAPVPASEDSSVIFENETTGSRNRVNLAAAEFPLLYASERGEVAWWLDLRTWMREQIESVGVDPDAMAAYLGEMVSESWLVVPRGPWHLGSESSEPRLASSAGRREVALEYALRFFGWGGGLISPADDLDRRNSPEDAKAYGVRLGTDGRPVERTIGCRGFRPSEDEVQALANHVASTGLGIGLRRRPTYVSAGPAREVVQVTLHNREGRQVGAAIAEAYDLPVALVAAGRPYGVRPPAQPPRAVPRPAPQPKATERPRSTDDGRGRGGR